jgi:hypothetical protein
MHVIPWLLLKQAIRMDGDESRPDTQVSMPGRVFRLLMEAALKGEAFDERAYLKANPDVAWSVQKGNAPSALQHYVSAGYFENRPTDMMGFDEEYYLDRYPDVKRAVQVGDCKSGHAHFSGEGVREWRCPNKAAEQDIVRWHEAVTPSAAVRPTPAPPPVPAQIAQTRPMPERPVHAAPLRPARQGKPGKMTASA